MSAAVDALATQVNVMVSAVGEAVTEIQTLAAQIAAGSEDPAILALSDKIKTAAASLHEAVLVAQNGIATSPSTPPSGTPAP